MVTLIAVLATSCGTAPDLSTEAPSTPGSGVYLPTYEPMEGLPVAQIRGRLLEDGGCLWIEQPEGRVLPLWPHGSRVEDDGTSLVVVNSGASRAVVGSEILGAGGEYGGPGHLDVVFEAIGEEVPDAVEEAIGTGWSTRSALRTSRPMAVGRTDTARVRTSACDRANVLHAVTRDP